MEDWVERRAWLELYSLLIEILTLAQLDHLTRESTAKPGGTSSRT